MEEATGMHVCNGAEKLIDKNKAPLFIERVVRGVELVNSAVH
jgi:hypothetical protein